MSRPSAIALTVIRVPRGGSAPDEASILAALEGDRAKLRLPKNGTVSDFQLAGPYPIVVDGEEVDEYVVWET